MVIAVKKRMILLLICIQGGLLCLFLSMSLHLMRMNHEINDYKEELVNYEKKVKKEEKTKKELKDKINEIDQDQQSKKERLANLETVKETTKRSIKNIEGQLGE